MATSSLRRAASSASNQARNIALERVSTKYVVFVENDVIVEPGWLEALLHCAEETSADIVAPLMLYGEVEEGRCHSFGGDFYYEERADGSLVLEERHRLSYVDIKVKRLPLVRSRCDYVEFHCLLARRDLFDTIGQLDEAISCSAENIDLCLQVRRKGGTVYVEPESIVAIVNETGHVLSDTAFFAVRWSDEWIDSSLSALQSKWHLPLDSRLVRDYTLFKERYQDLCSLPRRSGYRAGPGTDSHAAVETLDELAGRMTASYRRPAVEAVARAHAAAVALYADAGAGYLNHALATAGVLAACGVPPAVVVAGMQHAAYACGRFPASVGSDLAAARRHLAREIDSAAEEQVWEVYNLSLEAAEAATVEDDIEEVPLALAYAVLIRIACAVDARKSECPLHPLVYVAGNRAKQALGRCL